MSQPPSHLSPALLTALADGELLSGFSADQLDAASQHLAACPACTSSALAEALLKSATAKAGQRYSPPPDLRERLAHLLAQESATTTLHTLPNQRPTRGFSLPVWAMAAALLLVALPAGLIERGTQRTAQRPAARTAALATEVIDQHIATLAANSPPQVVSTDRHTVKPWFQGKLPFSFNLPSDLPADITLDGANLTYLDNRPAAQLLYSIGKHRVSVFLRQGATPSGRSASTHFSAERSGFHVAGFTTPDLEAVAVSDVEPARLTDFTTRLELVQTPAANPPQ
jgi:anti-sigma factor RsiW